MFWRACSKRSPFDAVLLADLGRRSKSGIVSVKASVFSGVASAAPVVNRLQRESRSLESKILNACRGSNQFHLSQKQLCIGSSVVLKILKSR